MQIDHDPDEQRPKNSNALWWVLWSLVTAGWVSTYFLFGFDWHQIALGAFSGMTLASWAIEITGNKTPKWMR
jgi:hypothetical protein